MLDADLAELYEVTTKALNQAVRRNRTRFPPDFMFQVTWEEARQLKVQLAGGQGEVRASRSQTVTLKRGTNIKYRPQVFTEHGVAMLSSVLHSERAIDVNIQIMRAFVRLRELMLTHRDIARKLDQLEKRTSRHDHEIKVVFEAIRQLIETPAPPRRRIGFRPD